MTAPATTRTPRRTPGPRGACDLDEGGLAAAAPRARVPAARRALQLPPRRRPHALALGHCLRRLHDAIYQAISRPHADPRSLIELGTLALLDYIEEEPDGFRIISRDSSPYAPGGTFQTILSSIGSRVEGLLAAQFDRRGFDPATAPLYSQMLVGLVALAGQWWVESHNQTTLTKPQVAAHLVNLAWNGMRNLQPKPVLRVAENPLPPVEDAE